MYIQPYDYSSTDNGLIMETGYLYLCFTML